MTDVISLKLEDIPDAIFLDEKVYVYSRLFNKRTCLNTLPKNDALRLYATMLIHAYTCLYMSQSEATSTRLTLSKIVMKR